MSKATVTYKGQITLPKAVRERLGVQAGDRVSFRETGDGVTLIVAGIPTLELPPPHPVRLEVRPINGRQKIRAANRRNVNLPAPPLATPRGISIGASLVRASVYGSNPAISN